MRRGHLVLAGLLLALSSGCNDDIDVPNRVPTVGFDMLTADGDVLEIWYWVQDPDGDDVRIDIQVCHQQDCLVPSPSPGGDGTENLPTLRNERVLHLYRWAAGCDVDASDFELERTVEIRPNDGHADGHRVQSDPFTLSGEGVQAGCSE